MKKTFILIALSALTIMAIAQDNHQQKTIQIAKQFINTPYVAKTLEINDEEDLVINCDEVDCTTFVEYVIAKTLTHNIADSLAFIDNLKRVRYRNGVINGYTSRLHYICDWIENGERENIIQDITKQNSSSIIPLSISYMSKHPQQYAQLKSSAQNLSKIAEIEKSLNGKVVSWLPTDSLPLNGLPYIHDGDIIALMTNISGLDVAHMGFAIYNDNKELFLLHASSKHKKVLIDPIPLKKLLVENNKWIGIRVLRIKE